MKIFGNKALSPMLWYVNRKSISKAMFIGTFWGILPIPFHTVLIVFTILIFEANLPIGLLLSWIMNPLTIVPILFLAFWIGSKIGSERAIIKCFTATATKLRRKLSSIP